MDRMIWIHADGDLDELREINYIASADMEINTADDAALVDNSWSMTLTETEWEKNPVRIGHHVYCPGTEWGGPVTYIKHETTGKKVTLRGPTWRGMLFQRRIVPPSGEAYIVYTNVDANTLISSVLGTAFGGLFSVSSTPAGVEVSASYRYQSMAAGLTKTLQAAGLRLSIAYDNVAKKVGLAAAAAGTQAETIELSQDYGVNFSSELGNLEYANHCLALGSGELTERTVLDVYRDTDGTITTTRPDWLTDALLRTVLLDYPNAEDADELLKSATERLLEFSDGRSLTIDTKQAGLSLEMGDKVAIRDRLTGLTATAEIRRRILTIRDGKTSIQDGVTTLSVDPEEEGE